MIFKISPKTSKFVSSMADPSLRVASACQRWVSTLAQRFWLPARDAEPQPALAELIEQGDVFSRADRVPGRQHQAERCEEQALRPRRKVGEHHHRVHREFEALGMELMLGEHQGIESGLVGENRDLPHLVKQSLVRLGVPAYRPPRLRVLLRAEARPGKSAG